MSESKEIQKPEEDSSHVDSIVIKPCPCGKTPESLHSVDNGQGMKWAQVSGNCCGEWSIEFRTGYNRLDSRECKDYALEAWNEAPRAL